ncbi:MAG: hypothetical protein HY912_07290 [Desulfomonile tiedjei]|uniref:Uncharacterized protein n=1 Tax=Desulfomonile tiedjei TaxID=2358 RepID=A0A9D6Z361_9BACT|nr:hypothetical protein [Desulfomonile tiedjei]
MKLTGAVLTGMLALMVLPFGVGCCADNELNQVLDSGSVTEPRDSTSSERKFPIAVPPASEVLSRIREFKTSRPPVQEKITEESPQFRMLRELMGHGAYVAPAEPLCFRPLPTSDMSMDTLRNAPVDANHILQRRNVDLRGVSPLPQLPVGLRQLPIETRGSNYPSRSAASQSSRLEWGINLKTHRFESYYSLNRSGNATLGLSLGRGKRGLGQYYKTGPNHR